VSGSKHTDPIRIRAPWRVRAPGEARGYRDPSTLQACARALKELGIRIQPDPTPPADDEPAPLPRLRVSRPRAGFHHPASRADIARLLHFFGATCTYGLQSVELLRAEVPSPGAAICFGRLLVPGRILLFDQPASPWILTGRLPETEAERLRRGGAKIEDAVLHTTVTWPESTLRDFMLFDVLMHEIGHHLIQQHKGKRPARVLRTREHEALADRFARSCRQTYAERQVRAR
jgi:hypothetical protein